MKTQSEIQKFNNTRRLFRGIVRLMVISPLFLIIVLAAAAIPLAAFEAHVVSVTATIEPLHICPQFDMGEFGGLNGLEILGAGGQGGNNGGGGTIITGDAYAEACIINIVNTNITEIDTCGDGDEDCHGDGDVTVENNNSASVENEVEATANTGDNTANGGDGSDGDVDSETQETGEVLGETTLLDESSSSTPDGLPEFTEGTGGEIDEGSGEGLIEESETTESQEFTEGSGDADGQENVLEENSPEPGPEEQSPPEDSSPPLAPMEDSSGE